MLTLAVADGSAYGESDGGGKSRFARSSAKLDPHFDPYKVRSRASQTHCSRYATVRGTRWYVANYTYGTLFKVSKGSVTIDPICGKNFNPTAGRSSFILHKR
ncbi:MAG: hypothetical protein ACSLFF_02340 [Solirubrobacterales bacterium]